MYELNKDQWWMTKGCGGGYVVGAGDQEMTKELPREYAIVIKNAPALVAALERLVATFDGAGESADPAWVYARKALAEVQEAWNDF